MEALSIHLIQHYLDSKKYRMIFVKRVLFSFFFFCFFTVCVWEVGGVGSLNSFFFFCVCLFVSYLFIKIRWPVSQKLYDVLFYFSVNLYHCHFVYRLRKFCEQKEKKTRQAIVAILNKNNYQSIGNKPPPHLNPPPTFLGKFFQIHLDPPPPHPLHFLLSPAQGIGNVFLLRKSLTKVCHLKTALLFRRFVFVKYIQKFSGASRRKTNQDMSISFFRREAPGIFLCRNPS